MSSNTFTNDKSQIILGNVYKLDFKVKRSLYWIPIERDPDSGNVLVVGIGKGLTKKLATLSVLAGRIVDSVQGETSSLNKTFTADARIRIYRDYNGTVTFYYKEASANSWTKWFDVPPRNIYSEKVLGFIPGIAGNEFSDNFTGDNTVVFEDMKIQRTEPFPFARNFDMAITNLQLASSATT